MKNIHKLLAAALTGTLIMSSIAGCTESSETEQSATDTQVTEETEETDTTDTTDTTQESTEATIRPKREGHYTFQTHVHPSKLEEIMGPEAIQAYDNMIDAVLAGEDYFEVADEETYGWVIGQFAYSCFPVIDDYIESGYAEGFSNGRGKITYLIEKEELQQKIADFEAEITEILNENLEDDYSDFEKALALYIYMAHHYTYNYEMSDNRGDYLVSGYQTLTDKSGICQGLSILYSYLLLQAGVDATVMSSYSDIYQDTHQWSYVKINGNYYHIDPTFALDADDSMNYFMMTDAKRTETGFNPEGGHVTIQYGAGEHVELIANDDTYAPLWTGFFIAIDHDNKKVIYLGDDENFNSAQVEFDYSALE